jgi:hypothetical protein
MAKNPIPKKVAGLKIPKTVRKSKTLRSLLSSHVGRELVASALTAGAGAAAAALAQPRESLGEPGRKRSAVGLVSDAIADGAQAMMGVVSGAARQATAPAKGKRRDGDPRH